MAQGRFITFEGGEGSGKSTQVALLAERLTLRGIEVTLTREPGGSPFAERLRRILLDPSMEPHAPLAEALLFYAARADHLEHTIRPALAGGRWVLCDRFSDSTRVYQGLAGTLNPKLIEALELLVVTPTRPDLTVLIDVPVEIGLARAEIRRTDLGASTSGSVAAPGRDPLRVARALLADRYESRGPEFHQRLRDGFLKIAHQEPQRCIIIDGVQSASEVADDIWAAIEERFFVEAD